MKQANKNPKFPPSGLTSRFGSIEFKQLDILGSEFQLKYTKHGSFKTNLGAVFSIILVFIVILASVVTILDFTSTNSPRVSISTKYSPLTPKFNLTKEKIVVPLSISTQSGPLTTINNPEGANKFVTIIGFIKREVVSDQTAQRKREYILTIKYKPCRSLDEDTGWFLDAFSWHQRTYDLIDNFGLCPVISKDDQNYLVQSKLQDPPTVFLEIFIFPCSLPDASQCGDLSQLKDKQVVSGIINKGFTPSNLSEPVSIVTEFDQIQMLDMKLYKRNVYKMRQNEIWDQRMDFFEPKLRMRYADYFLDFTDHMVRDENQKHCDYDTLIDPDQLDCLPFFSYSFRASGEKRVIIRTYPMFFSSLGEIGGTAEIISLLFILLYSWYNNYFLGKYVKHEVFDDKIKEEFKSLIVEEKNNLTQKLDGKTTTITQKNYETHNILKVDDNINKNPQKEKNDVMIRTEELEDLLDSTIEDNESGIRLFKAMNELNVLKKIFLKPQHETLIPVLSMHLKKMEGIKNNQHL